MLPPQSIQAAIADIQSYFSDRYDSRAALRSPPHITLQAPFAWLPDNIATLQQHLEAFVHNYTAIPITLDGFAAFAPRVIYVDVVKSPTLIALQADLAKYMETTVGVVDPKGRSRPFTPHMTVAFRDLTRQNFKAAWEEFKERSLHFEFAANCLTLLLHDGQQWNIHSEFPFNSL
ncbi:MAG: 2'-5' RNA ligase family protein [Pseudanabaena sp. CRU_2_10]|nr:2'-5' RNA ligase family protein [Pseudanabaena sp. CRU_2_10]